MGSGWDEGSNRGEYQAHPADGLAGGWPYAGVWF